MKRILFVLALVSFWLIPATGLTREYFLYDHEQNVILNVNDNSKTEIIKSIGLTKNPDSMMAIGIPDCYLAIFNSIQIGKGREQAFYQPGKIVVFNAKVGRSEDLVEIGFAPYQWVYTKDRLHFFIAYYLSPKKEGVEILHYDIKEKRIERISDITGAINDLQLNYEEDALLAIVDSKDSLRKLVRVQIAPFQLKSEFEIGAGAERIYVLGPNRAALLNINKKRSRKYGSGVIKIIDTYGNALVEERTLFHPNIAVFWYEENRSLFVTNGLISDGLMEGRLYKVTGAGIRQHQIPSPWAGFNYQLEQDRVYVLNDNSLTLIDYPNNFSRTFKLDGPNYYPAQFSYYFQRLFQTNLAIIACFEKGYLKFYDLEKNQVLKSVNCGRTGKRVINKLTFRGDRLSQTALTTNQWQTRFYVLNRATQDITVYNHEFNVEKYIIPEEPPLAIFQITRPTIQTLVVTAKGLYRVDEDNLGLVPVTNFASEISKVHYLEEKEGLLFLYTDRFLMIIEPEELQVKHCFYLYGDPAQKYTKLSDSERRYYFIPEL